MGFDLYGLSPHLRGIIPNKERAFSDSEEDRNSYYRDLEAFNKENPGYYFRNNVWWWRHLWKFVSLYCSDILSEEDLEAGNYNDGHVIEEDKAYRLGIRLFKLIEEGDAAVYQLMVEESKTTEKDSFSNNYQFDVANLREFATFCIESGGFSIY